MRLTLTAIDIALIVVMIGLGLVIHDYWRIHPTVKEYEAIKRIPKGVAPGSEAATGTT